MKKIYWLQVVGQCGSNVDIRISVPAGLTLEQTAEIEQHINDMIDIYGAENDGDYERFSYNEAIEKILDEMGIIYRYAPIEYTIHL